VGEVHGEIRDEELEAERDAERDARRRLALAQIRQYPDAALRMKAKPVEAFDDDLRRLAERMTVLMVDAVGVGLAATQVGILQRLFVFVPGTDREPAVIANPVITVTGDEVETGDEGCLSLQGVLAPVARAVSLRLDGKDVNGKDVSHELEGYPARTAQHELDHLDGVLIIDRTTPEARREAMAVLRPRVVIG
jgi:peptide deformylase